MKCVLSCLIFSLFLSLPGLALDRACPKPSAEEEVLYSNDFKWGVSFPEMKKKFEEIYASGKRLKARAYYDEREKAYVFPREERLIRLDPKFIQSVTRQVEISLERRYADFVFFPDMGHSHFYVPDRDWPEVSKHTTDPKDTYETLMGLRSLKVLYHTAEQLKVREGERGTGAFPQDTLLLWRYDTRNVVGDNNGGENVYPLYNWEDKPPYNSVGSMEGHRSWSAGFNISASKNGCFPYRHKGETLYFDLSLEDLPYKSDSSGDENQ